MAAGKFHPLLTGTAITSAGTLASRLLGLARAAVAPAWKSDLRDGPDTQGKGCEREPNPARASHSEGGGESWGAAHR